MVGLELIANGGQKPRVKYQVEPPKELAAGSDYGVLRWFEFPPELREILQKSIQKSGKSDWSIPERCERLFDFLGKHYLIEIGLLELLVNWRNALVHRRTSKFRLPQASDQIRQAQAKLATQYAQIDICKTLDSFKDGKWPTLKEATTLLAIAQNLAKGMDEALIGKFASSASGVEEIARKELAIALRECEGGWKRIWGRDVEARRRAIAQLLASAGISDGGTCISAELSSSFVDDLASADKDDIERLISTLVC